MWSVENRTAYGVAGDWGRDREGVHEWIVGVRATFDIGLDEGLTIADAQPDPLAMPRYRGEDGSSSLEYDADLVGAKLTTDVVLNGTAHAPNGQPVPEFLVSMRVGQVKKRIKVVGDRVWERGALGLGASSPKRVTEVPIIYERSFGGSELSDPDPVKRRMDARNPVGRGLVAREGHALPNFEYPGAPIETAGPAGFGALASFWSPRRELAGTYDEAWRNSRYPLLPGDWDPRSLQCAPADQRPDTHLQGGEPVELINLSRSGVLRFVLPRLRFTFRTIFSTGFGTRAKDHDAYLGTVILEPDYPRVVLVWLSTLICPTDPDYLNETIVTEVLTR